MLIGDLRTASLVLPLLLLAACGAPVEIPGNPVDEMDILQTAGSGTYHGDDFEHAVSRPFPSELATDAAVDLWISDFALNEFLKVVPAEEGSGAQLPPGSIVYRDVYNPGGELRAITIMAKGGDGFYPAGGDFWYGSLEPDGTPMMDDAGNPLTGRIRECAQCHEQRKNDGWLFGAPLSAR